MHTPRQTIHFSHSAWFFSLFILHKPQLNWIIPAVLITTPADRLLNFNDQYHVYPSRMREREYVHASELKSKVNCSINWWTSSTGYEQNTNHVCIHNELLVIWRACFHFSRCYCISITSMLTFPRRLMNFMYIKCVYVRSIYFKNNSTRKRFSKLVRSEVVFPCGFGWQAQDTCNTDFLCTQYALILYIDDGRAKSVQTIVLMLS